jgi:hypothetical protein
MYYNEYCAKEINTWGKRKETGERGGKANIEHRISNVQCRRECRIPMQMQHGIHLRKTMADAARNKEFRTQNIEGQNANKEPPS